MINLINTRSIKNRINLINTKLVDKRIYFKMFRNENNEICINTNLKCKWWIDEDTNKEVKYDRGRN